MAEIVAGVHAVQGLMQKRSADIFRVAIANDHRRLAEFELLASTHGIALEKVDKSAVQKLAGNINHQGVAAECRPYEAKGETFLEELVMKTPKCLLLVLDNVQDPHNLGACLRSAEAAGAAAVIAPKQKAVGLTGTVRKVACGAAELVPFIQITNLARTLRTLKTMGVWVVGADMADDETTLYDVDLTASTAMVMGAEGTGLRRLTREHCDVIAPIPMPGTMESLNVSVAAGVFLFEAVRQRRSQG